MLNWTRQEIRNRIVIFRTTILPEHSIESAAKEFWKTIPEEFFALNESIDWDRFRLEIWADSGRIICFPENQQLRKRIDKSLCELDVPALAARNEEILIENEDDEIAADRLQEEQQRYARAFLDAASDLAKHHAKPIAIFSADDLLPFAQTLPMPQ